MEIPPLSLEDVKLAIMCIKNNKPAGPDGLPAELFKIGCNELVGRMHQAFFTKKGASTVCVNYRSISLLPITYKVLTCILCERVKPLVKTLFAAALRVFERKVLRNIFGPVRLASDLTVNCMSSSTI